MKRKHDLGFQPGEIRLVVRPAGALSVEELEFIAVLMKQQDTILLARRVFAEIAFGSFLSLGRKRRSQQDCKRRSCRQARAYRIAHFPLPRRLAALPDFPAPVNGG